MSRLPIRFVTAASLALLLNACLGSRNREEYHLVSLASGKSISATYQIREECWVADSGCWSLRSVVVLIPTSNGTVRTPKKYPGTSLRILNPPDVIDFVGGDPVFVVIPQDNCAEFGYPPEGMLAFRYRDGQWKRMPFSELPGNLAYNREYLVRRAPKPFLLSDLKRFLRGKANSCATEAVAQSQDHAAQREKIRQAMISGVGSLPLAPPSLLRERLPAVLPSEHNQGGTYSPTRAEKDVAGWPRPVSTVRTVNAYIHEGYEPMHLAWKPEPDGSEPPGAVYSGHNMQITPSCKGILRGIADDRIDHMGGPFVGRRVFLSGESGKFFDVPHGITTTISCGRNISVSIADDAGHVQANHHLSILNFDSNGVLLDIRQTELPLSSSRKKVSNGYYYHHQEFRIASLEYKPTAMEVVLTRYLYSPSDSVGKAQEGYLYTVPLE